MRVLGLSPVMRFAIRWLVSSVSRLSRLSIARILRLMERGRLPFWESLLLRVSVRWSFFFSGAGLSFACLLCPSLWNLDEWNG